MIQIAIAEKDRDTLRDLHGRLANLMAEVAWIETEFKGCRSCRPSEQALQDFRRLAARIGGQLVMAKISEIAKAYGLPEDDLTIAPDFSEFRMESK